MRGFIALLVLVTIIGYCSMAAGYIVNLLLAPIHPDLGMFVGCFASVVVFFKMWKKLLGGNPPNTPGTPGIQG